MFCIDEGAEMRSFDFLQAAFDAFPGKQFCVITLPHMDSEMPLLAAFTRATPNPKSLLPQELYVLNRNGLLKDFTVRMAEQADLEPAERLLEGIEGREFILSDVNTCFCSATSRPFANNNADAAFASS